MMKRIKEKSGAIMLEALIVYTITIFLLFFILALFSVFYQIWDIQTIANETAAKLGQIYRYVDTDMTTGYVSEDQIAELENYRYLSGYVTGWENDLEEKAISYAEKRLDHTSFVRKITEPEISVKVEKDDLASRHLVVEVKEKFTVPFGEALEYFGFDSEIEYKAAAYADCLDIIDYINTVDFVKKETSLKQFGSKTVSMVNAILKLFHHIADLL